MGRIATIGFFDGVHLGHQYVLQQLVALSHSRHEQSLVVTFRQHPRQVLETATSLQLLTTPTEREARLRANGVEEVAMLNFPTIQQLTAHAFMEYLHHEWQVDTLLLGYDHRFGSDCLTSFHDYEQIGNEVGITILPLQEFQDAGQHVSSTAIRKALLAGEIEKANHLLGYTYTLTGTVVAGRQIGREIGFPTANIMLTADKLIPKYGVWVVDVEGLGIGLLNIGSNPTVGGTNISIEVHILHYTGNLYNQALQLHLLHYIREEQKFATLTELKQQIEQDIQVAIKQEKRD